MALVSRLSYQRLKHELDLDDDSANSYERDRVILKTKNWFRFRKARHIRRRFRIKIPSLRRLVRKARLASRMRISCAKVYKRLMDSQAHFGDLFAGNYLFMQVNPISTKLKLHQRNRVIN